MTNNPKHITPFVFSILLLLITSAADAQNLETIGKGKLLKVSGNLSTSHVLYGVDGIDSRRDPYNYYFSGNVNFSVYGWNVPLSFSYSNQRSSFRQPFNQFGMRPSYKWITGYAGYNSMNFSRYTLGGHIFLGGGVELTPGKWQVSAMYGRLQKPVAVDSLSDTNIMPAYKRMGYGFKVGYADGGDEVHVILFRARDDESSIPAVPDSLNVNPMENLVLSILGTKTLGEHFVVNAEIAGSAITQDTRATEYDPDNKNVFAYTGGLFTPRTSSSYYNAYKAGVNYNLETMSIGVGYERVDPGYQTLGAYYFNNDLESYTLNASYSFPEAKVNLSANGGMQRNNLDNTQMNQTNRWVGSINASYQPGERLNLSSSYSNFTTFTDVRSEFESLTELTPYDNLDTLDYEQVSQSANLNANYQLKKSKAQRQNLNVNLTYQDATDKQGGVATGTGSTYYNYNVAYNLNYSATRTNFTVAFNGNNVVMQDRTTSTYGPTFSVSKSMMEQKWRNTFSTSYISSHAQGAQVSRVMNARLSSNYSIKQKHNLNLSAVVLNRKTQSETASAFTEYTVTLAYNYNF